MTTEEKNSVFISFHILTTAGYYYLQKVERKSKNISLTAW